jgi:hypothetical protein
MGKSNIEPSGNFPLMSVRRPGADICLDHLMPQISETCGFKQLPGLLRYDSGIAIKTLHTFMKELCPPLKCGICRPLIVVTSRRPVNLNVFQVANTWSQVPSQGLDVMLKHVRATYSKILR